MSAGDETTTPKAEANEASANTLPDVGRPGFAKAEDVDLFVEMLERFESGQISADDWRAFRLVNGTYGQRQDDFMMIRAKIPQGILNPAQLEVLAQIAESYAGSGFGHVTTRQNIQLHFIKLADAPKVLDLLASAGITTREACGNSVRNITGCPYAGVSQVEPFDVTPYAEATTRHFLRRELAATLPRKFKIAFGGCCGHDDVQAQINDLGFLATLGPNGERAFKVYMGGGLSTLRRAAFLVHELLPAEEVLDVAEALVRTFHRIGNRKDKHKARLKWAIQKLGVQGFLAEYNSDLAAVRAEGGCPRVVPAERRDPVAPPPSGELVPALPDYEAFAATNVRPQRQPGFSSVLVRLVLGDVRPPQFRALARLVKEYGEGELRTTNEQNLLIRFVPTWRVPALHRDLTAIGLGLAGAATVGDVLSCPGASTCRIAVTASRGLGSLLTEHLRVNPDVAALAPNADIKISGCPNGCGQHYSAAIGFQGGMRKVDGKPVPQYFVYVGGGFPESGATFGRVAGKVPARRAPQALERLLKLYAEEKAPGERPEVFFQRVELAKVQAIIKDLSVLDSATVTADDFVDLGESKAFEVVEMEGECAA